jgi:hypothetical protein
MIALVVPGVGARDVARAKKDMSVFMRGQGRVPLRPIPRRVDAASLGVEDATRMGVVATMRVRGREWGIWWVDGGGMVELCRWMDYMIWCEKGGDYGLNWIEVGVGEIRGRIGNWK